MLQNKIYYNYFLEIFKTFLTIIAGLSLIALTVRAVNFLDLIVDNGYSLLTYFKYSILNIFGIAPKFFPIAFLISIIIFIFKNKNNGEFIILWSTGVKKIVIVNLLLLTSVCTIFLYLFLSVYLTPVALNKSRQMLSQSQFSSFLPTIKSKQFSDSFKGLTFFVEEKINNEVKNIFLHDNGNNLKNLSSNTSEINSTVIIAEKGLVEKKSLFLINGEIISNKKSNKNEIIKFEQLNINLGSLSTTIIRQPKLQETSTLTLLKCLIGDNVSKICNQDVKKEITPIILRRLVLPLYIPVFCLLCSFLFFKNEKDFFYKFSVIVKNIILLIFIELVIKYTGTNHSLRLFYIIFPFLIAATIYPFLLYNFSKKI